MIFSISDYKDCLLFDDSFKTLKHLTPVKDEQDDFVFSSGRNSVVFKMLDNQTNSHKALKCFINVNEEQLANIKAVSDYMKYIRSPYLVPYQFYEEEIWLASAYEEPCYYPVLLMDWVEGTSMGSYLKTLCDEDDFEKIKDLALSFDQMAHWLLQQEFAHGDLKLDNMIVNPNGMPILIDYDGCFIPGMENQLAPELGTPGYQHPLRDEHFFNRQIDHVSVLVISSALHALVQKPDLWYDYDNGENLLFTPTDLSNISESKLWKELFKLENELINNRLALLQMGLPTLKPINGIIEVMRINTQIIDFYHCLFSEKNINQDLFSYCIDDEWGFVNKQKRIVIHCMYQEVKEFADGLAAVMQKNKWGFVNKNGDEIIPLIYQEVTAFNKGIARAKLNGKYGYINKVGRVVIPFIYDLLGLFKDGYTNYWITKDDYTKDGYTNNWSTKGKGIIDEDGNVISFGEKYDGINVLSNNLIKVSMQEYCYGLTKRNGEVITPMIYDSIYSIGDGVFVARLENNHKLFDIRGTFIAQILCDSFIENFSEGIACVKWNDRYGFIDKKGYIVIPTRCLYAQSFKEGLALVYSGKYGFIDKFKNNIIPHIYDAADSFNDGMAKVKFNNKWGAIDKKGKNIIPFIYDDWLNFINGVSIVVLNKKYGIIDKKGKVLISAKYDKIERSNCELFIVTQGFKKGILNLAERVITDIKYDYIQDCNKEGISTVCIGNLISIYGEEIGKWGFVDKLCKELCPIIYHKIENFDHGFAKVCINNKWGLINKEGKEITPLKYDKIQDFDTSWGKFYNYDLFKVGLHGKWGLINKFGKELTLIKFDDILKINNETVKGCIDKKWGLINKFGKELTQFKYDYIDYLENGMACVVINKKQGVINKKGEEIIEVMFDYVGYGEGFVVANLWKFNYACYIDKNENKLKVEPDYYNASVFKEGLSRVRSRSTFKYGFINQFGKEIIPFIYDNCSDFENGICEVQINRMKGLIDKTGKVIVPPKYDGVEIINNNFVIVNIDNENSDFLIRKCGLYHINGKEVTEIKYDYICDDYCGPESYGLRKVSIGGEWIYRENDYSAFYEYKGGKWGIIDFNGVEITSLEYDSISDFNEDFFIVEIGRFSGVLNIFGELITPLKYSEIIDYKDGLFAVLIRELTVEKNIKNEKWGLIDKTGKEITPIKYDQIGDFENGVARVICDKKWGVIDKTGTEIAPLIYNYVINLVNNFIMVNMNNSTFSRFHEFESFFNTSWGILDRNGMEIIPIKYDFIGDFINGTAIACIDGKRESEDMAKRDYFYYHFYIEFFCYGGKWGKINEAGEEVIPFKYDYLEDFDGELIIYQMGNWGVIDHLGNEIIPNRYLNKEEVIKAIDIYLETILLY